MRKVWITLFLMLLVFTSQAQKSINGRETFGEAYEYFLSNDYPEALFSFEQLIQFGYGNSNISYLIGVSYLNTPGQERKAILSLEDAIKNISESYNEGSFDETSAPLQAYYYLAQSYRISGDYIKARDMLVTLLDHIDTTKDKSTVSLIKHELEYGNNAATLMKMPVSVSIINAGNAINSSLDELNPAITADGSTIFFVVKKKFYDAIYQDHKLNDNWTEKEEITNRLGSDGEYRVLSVSADGTKMLLYSYDMFSGGDIYESKINGNKWSKCRKLNKNINSAYSENFASYSPDGKTLYFTSNRPGGIGGYDIYKSGLGSDDDWAEATNLGPDINTEFDEASPSCSQDGKYLFFSSKGHFGMGGFDIFRSKINNDKFLYPRNVGYPLNTCGDNFGLTPLESGLSGYFPAIMPEGSGGFDIWKYQLSEPPNLARFTISGKIRSNDTLNSYIPEYSVCLNEIEANAPECLTLKSGKAFFEFKRPAGNFQLEVRSKGFNRLTKDLRVDPEQLESVMYLDLELEKTIIAIPKRSFDLHTIFFQFNSRILAREYYNMLDSLAILLSEFPTLQLKLTGFADGKGKTAYNNNLSLQRAESVMKYLSTKNTDTTRMVCSGMGSKNPIAIEKTIKGKDLPEGRSWNRRVEISFSSINTPTIRNIAPPVPQGLRIGK
jgi:outer membrane protein OmpA-like peptidoglycan-associated protein